MDRICRVAPLLVIIAEVREVRCEGVTVEEDCMVRVNFPDGVEHTIVELNNSSLGCISRFVERIVSGNPGVAFVVLSELLPEPDSPVLEVLMQPECSNVAACISMPVGILPSRS